ncbi:hypothetical protein Rhal01_02947 [Rubritalea halochordaticola]|uniref:3-keto-alpha-glucoside-1,2-lyase/3-keto-2-hydroxy-glucal hydratase domain-containing protein n=1 Tax=Rubritalea halochordaticola TaxID=714537 RepID=A0ABP9V7Z8_9BACT
MNIIKNTILACAFVLPVTVLAESPKAPDTAATDKTIKLFNGKDLKGWRPDVPAADHNKDTKPSFIVRDGKLVSMGRPLGHLTTNQVYSDYRLVVEYRFSGKKEDGSIKTGNCGVLVHSSTPRALYKMFPASIEVQMMSGSAGDFWCIEQDITVPDMEKRRPKGKNQKFGGSEGDARNIKNLTDGSEKTPGEWNTMIIDCVGDEIKVWVNGDFVNHGTGCTVSKGQIALQAEGTEVEFRKVELTPLPAK